MTAINRDDWLRALQDVGLDHAGDENAITILEMAAMLGLGRAAARHRLEALEKAGKAIRTRKRVISCIGRSITSVAFRLLDTPREKGGSDAPLRAGQPVRRPRPRRVNGSAPR